MPQHLQHDAVGCPQQGCGQRECVAKGVEPEVKGAVKHHEPHSAKGYERAGGHASPQRDVEEYPPEQHREYRCGADEERHVGCERDGEGGVFGYEIE